MTRALRTPVLLAGGSVVNGLLAYLLFALVTRGLGATVAAPVSVLGVVLWSAEAGADHAKQKAGHTRWRK